MSNNNRGASNRRAPMDPQRLAAEFIKKHASDSLRRKTIRFWRSEFWVYRDGYYRALAKSEFNAVLTKALTEHIGSASVRGNTGVLCMLRLSDIANVSAALAGELHVPDAVAQPTWLDDAKRHSNRLAMRNGIVDIDAALSDPENALRSHTPDWFSAVALPYEFDPKADCPKFKRFIDDTFGSDPEMIRLVQQVLGYCLTPGTSLQKFFILEGEGANGKSVLMDVMKGLIGAANCSHVPLESFGERFQLHATVNKLVNFASEVRENAKINEGVIKQFTGGDTMYIDRKFLGGIDFTPTAKLIVAVNERPSISDRSSGLWRRMVILPFPHSVPPEKQNPRLAEELKQELPGILNWALLGRADLIATGAFVEPAASKSAVAEYRAESNPARSFLAEHCVADSGRAVLTDYLYRAYKNWAFANGHTVLTNAAFGKEVKRAFPHHTKKRVKSDGVRRWSYEGIAMSDDEGRSHDCTPTPTPNELKDLGKVAA